MLLDKDPWPSIGVQGRLPGGGVRTESLGQASPAAGGEEGRRGLLSGPGLGSGLGEVGTGSGVGRWPGRHRGPAPGRLAPGPRWRRAPERPPCPRVPAARGEARRSAGQQEAAAPPGPRALHGCWRPMARTPRTGREGGREAARGGPGHPTSRGASSRGPQATRLVSERRPVVDRGTADRIARTWEDTGLCTKLGRLGWI